MPISVLFNFFAALLLVGSLAAGDQDYQPFDGMARLGAYMDVPSAEQQATNGIDSQTGVNLISIMPDTAASRMGLHPNDVVLSVNGSTITTMTDLRNEIALAGVGNRVDVVIARDGKRLEMHGDLGEWPKDEPRNPIDPASERGWRDWQAQRLQRMQDSVADLRRKVEDLEREPVTPAAPVKPVQDLTQAAGLPVSQALRALPAWRLTLELRQDDDSGKAQDTGRIAWEARALVGTPAPEIF